MLPVDSWTEALTGKWSEMKKRLKQKKVELGDKSNDKIKMQNQ